MQVLDSGFCSACFNHVLDQPVVDFGADWEGGMVDGLSIDDLRLCESCVQGAARALAIDPKDVERVANEAESLRRELDEARAYAVHLEDALAAKPVVSELPKVAKTGRKKAVA